MEETNPFQHLVVQRLQRLDMLLVVDAIQNFEVIEDGRGVNATALHTVTVSKLQFLPQEF